MCFKIDWTSLITGIIHTMFIMFIMGLVIANMLLRITWLDMRINLGGLIPAFILVAVALFVLNRFYPFVDSFFWEKKVWSLFFIPIMLLLLLISNDFNVERLSIVPASTVRQGLGWSRWTLNEMNKLIVFLFTIGLMNIMFYRAKKAREIMMEKKQRVLIGIVLGLLAISLTLYLAIPGVRYFINEGARMLATADIEAFRDYLLSFGAWAPVISAFLMVFQSVAAPLPAFVITFGNGLLFGAFWGGLLSWSSAMVGAALCFYIARALGRPAVEKLVTKTAVDWTDQFITKYGKHSILIARLLPIVSFDLVSYGAGLTSIRFWGFFLATGLGQAPATIVYSYLGQTVSQSVMVLFWVFVGITCLVIAIAAWKKRSSFMRSNR